MTMENYPSRTYEAWTTDEDGTVLWTIQDLDFHTDPLDLRFVEVVEGSAVLEVIEDDQSKSEVLLHPGVSFGFYPRQEHRVVGGPVTLHLSELC